MKIKVTPMVAMLILVQVGLAIARPIKQQALDARLALCATAEREYPDLRAGKIVQDKDPLLLTLQSALGIKAGRVAVQQAWTDYQDKRWTEADCRRLSRARWAAIEGYQGHPLQVPEGAIGAIMKAQGWSEPPALPAAPIEQ
jgi:hypothetical protein